MYTITLKEEIIDVINDIFEISDKLGHKINKDEIKIEDRGCPHKIPSLPKGKCAVYMFFYNGKALKIGKANEKSKARFESQHYGFNAISTLAKSLVGDEEMPIFEFNKFHIKEWMLNNLHRIDILANANDGDAKIELIEAVMHYKFRPKYEGVLHRKS